ncbi:hypothetical protein T492DRAFT_834697 [Pavlovales sp. CCMP2436]|nr:hypothetical protein T492DRAFT_834697 [Pavlovales sp. CCMP2436]
MTWALWLLFSAHACPRVRVLLLPPAQARVPPSRMYGPECDVSAWQVASHSTFPIDPPPSPPHHAILVTVGVKPLVQADYRQTPPPPSPTLSPRRTPPRDLITRNRDSDGRPAGSPRAAEADAQRQIAPACSTAPRAAARLGARVLDRGEARMSLVLAAASPGDTPLATRFFLPRATAGL